MEMKNASNLFKLKQTEKITTDIKSIDKFLRGGIALGKITELVGTPGTGKTQMCLRLCLNVQLPQKIGGVEGKALFLDTRKDFDPARLQELATDLEKRLQNQLTDFKASDMLKNVFYLDCPSAAQLIASILNLRKLLSAQPTIKLIVVDSLAFPIRMLESVAERTALLMEIHDAMQRILRLYSVTFVITNELGYHRRKRRWQLQPILGQKHMHLINERIWCTENEYFMGKTLNTRMFITKK
ncbi:DNA repair protein RAD51 homolog 3 [Drosophila innubila]|uniref:DNA repair protein RAD51 homolog 3 n=1 Tax=Drosophila innubila TaxID=198719 RepID=UPI00148D5034|nr:DNA repair protein RAD51 homolog 3 [Drosophila innubila]